MIKILDEGLDLSLDFLSDAGMCPELHNCLWMKRELIQNCPMPGCRVLAFRDALESESPAFYAETLRLSLFGEARWVALNLMQKRNPMMNRFIQQIYDLHTFGELVILSLYPLFQETREIPFLKTAEIKKLRIKFYRHAEVVRRTERKINKINSDWYGWIRAISENFFAGGDHYPLAALYLVYLFFKGFEKNRLPDMQMTLEKEKFFTAIKEYLAQNKKRANPH